MLRRRGFVNNTLCAIMESRDATGLVPFVHLPMVSLCLGHPTS